MTFGLNVCLIFSSAFAQKETPPEGGEPKDFNLPAKQMFMLDNGLEATLVPYGTLPKVTVRIVVRVGNINESEDEVWLADLTGDMMKEGTKSLSSEEVALKAAGMGGEVDISVGADQTNISGDVLSEFGPDFVALLADIVCNPLLPESEIDRLKKDMLRNLNIRKSQPQSMALEKFREVLYPNHPYGRVFPTQEMIASYTQEKVQSFYENNFGAARTHVYVAGRFDEDEVESAIRNAFENWRRGPEALINIPSPQSERAIYLINRPNAAQSTIYMGLPVIGPANENWIPLQVTNTLLGGFFSSRITTNIREDKGYTYSPFSQISTRYRDAYWLESADVTTSVTGPSLREIFYEIDRLQDEPPPKEELDGVENYMAGTFVLQNSSPSGIISQLAFMDLHGLNESYLTEYVQRVHAVAPEQVQDMARQYIKDNEMTIVIAGDRRKIYQQVSNYGPVVE